MSLSSWVKEELQKLGVLAKDETPKFETAVAPVLALGESQGTTEALQIGEKVLIAAATGTPWSVLLPSFTTELAKDGIQLAEQVASGILNLSQANLQLKGTATGATAVPAADTKA